MEFTGVYHKTSEQMSYPLDEDRLIVNIKTGYDVNRCLSITEILMRPGFWVEMKNGQEKERKLFIKNVCLIKSGGQQRFFLYIKDVNIILN